MWSRIIGSTGIPVYNMSAGCAAGGNAFNVGYSMVAGGVYDMVLVVGGEVMPKGMIQTSGLEDPNDPEFLRQRCIGFPGPSFWATLARRRMHDFGTTEEQFARSPSRRASARSATPTPASRKKSPWKTC
jgi:acetyl-CoA acetyltransferase